MFSSRSIAAFTACVLASTAAPAARAAESYDNCAGTIVSVPATITTQGVWCLTSDLSTAIVSGNAITVAANNVTIDCNGFKLGGLAAGTATEADGIDLQGRVNAVVRNCTIRGFLRGVSADAGGSGHLVEDNRLDGNTFQSINLRASGSIVRRNIVLDTGGSTGGYPTAYGMWVANGVDVLDNTIAGVLPGAAGSAVRGIYADANDQATIGGNRISGLAPAVGNSYAIITAATSATIIEGNQLYGPDVAGSTAILCASNRGTSVRNTVVDFATGVSTCHSVDDVVNPN